MRVASTSVVGFRFGSGEAQNEQMFSGLPPKADIERHDWHVGFVPKGDISANQPLSSEIIPDPQSHLMPLEVHEIEGR
jgi:hypothetical protein